MNLKFIITWIWFLLKLCWFKGDKVDKADVNKVVKSSWLFLVIFSVSIKFCLADLSKPFDIEDSDDADTVDDGDREAEDVGEQ